MQYYPLLASFPPSLHFSFIIFVQRAANEASTIGQYCTLYVVIGRITHTLRVIALAYNIIHSYSRTIHVIFLQKCANYTFSTLTYSCYCLQLTPPFSSAPKAPNRSARSLGSSSKQSAKRLAKTRASVDQSGVLRYSGLNTATSDRRRDRGQ